MQAGGKSILHGTLVGRTFCVLVIVVLMTTITSVSSLSSSSSSSSSGSSSSSSSSSNPTLPKATVASTIAVCTGPDCRIDGSTGSLKQLQKTVGASLSPEIRKNTKIKVTGRSCLGPCGDGPCVVVLDANGKRVVGKQKQPAETLIGSGSLVPADIFGVNATGVYQVRTQENVNFVVDIALETAGIEKKMISSDGNISSDDEGGEASIDDTNNTNDESSSSPSTVVVVTSSVRPWWDRPRNERKVLQRLAQVSIIYGLYHSNNATGEIADIQYQVAGILIFASFFITYGKAI